VVLVMVGWAGPELPLVARSGSAFAAEKLPTAEEVIAKMKAKWAGMKSIEMDQLIVTEIDKPREGTTSTVHRAAERVEKEGIAIERICTVSRAVSKSGEGQESWKETKSINDGRFFWEEEKNSENKRILVTKRDAQDWLAEKSSYAWGPGALETAKMAYDVKVVREETIDGQRMYVLEGELKPPEGHSWVWKKTVWIGVADLCIHHSRYTFVDDGDKTARPVLTTFHDFNIKVDQEIDPKVFEYTPPEGAVVEDRTKN
jgi:outer membrane lipoprotein-sorting protein